jgi:hypothetical protein
VVTTASAKNHNYIKSLTAGDHVTVFDYADAEVVSKLVAHIKDSGLKFVGAYETIGTDDTMRASAEVVHALGGGPLPVVRFQIPEGLPEDVKAEVVWCTNAGMVPGHPAGKVWETFVPAALKNGTLKAKPEADVVGTGLDSIQGAITLHSKGVSAKKIVVTL